jgi:hypothetical protein
LGATDDGGDARVVEAGEGSVEKVSLNGRSGLFEFGDGDFHWLGRGAGFDAELRVAEPEDLSGFQNGFVDGFVVDESAVGRAEVADEDGISGDEEFAMEAGDGGVMDAEVVGGIAANAEEAIDQFDGTRVSNTGQQKLHWCGILSHRE